MDAHLIKAVRRLQHGTGHAGLVSVTLLRSSLCPDESCLGSMPKDDKGLSLVDEGAGDRPRDARLTLATAIPVSRPSSPAAASRRPGLARRRLDPAHC